MDGHLNFIDQERRAKLNLLVLDDDNAIDQVNETISQEQNWGRSLETQSYLRQKLSHHYKNKRRSLKQLKASSILNKGPNEKSTFNSDKQSLKELLKKLQSKDIKRQTSKNQTIQSFSRIQSTKRSNNRSVGAILQSRNRSFSKRNKLRQSIQANQSNAYTTKISLAKILISQKNLYDQSLCQNRSILRNCQNADQIKNRRIYMTENKHKNNKKKLMFKRNYDNKENQPSSSFQLAGDISSKARTAKQICIRKDSVLVYKTESIHTKCLTDSYRLQNVNNKPHVTCEFTQNELINKRTFQILQQIDRTKTISSIKKLACQSVKFKKPQFCAYSRIQRDKGNICEQGKDSNVSKNGNFGNKTDLQSSLIRKKNLFKNNIENYWVKLQIRG